jgi:hypothetical protein
MRTSKPQLSIVVSAPSEAEAAPTPQPKRQAHKDTIIVFLSVRAAAAPPLPLTPFRGAAGTGLTTTPPHHAGYDLYGDHVVSSNGSGTP